MQRRLEEWLERCLEKDFVGGLEGSFVWGLDGRLEDYLEWVLERGVEPGFSVLKKYEVWTLHGAISIRKGRFLKLVPRLRGPWVDPGALSGPLGGTQKVQCSE